MENNNNNWTLETATENNTLSTQILKYLELPWLKQMFLKHCQKNQLGKTVLIILNVNVSKWPDTLKILQYLLQDIYIISDHFGAFCMKGFCFTNKFHEDAELDLGGTQKMQK